MKRKRRTKPYGLPTQARRNRYNSTYSSWYKKHSSKHGGITALSNLRLVRLEFEERLKPLLDSQYGSLKTLRSFVNEISGQNDNLSRISEKIEFHLEYTFPYVLHAGGFQSTPEELMKLFEKINESSGNTLPINVRMSISQVFIQKKELEHLIQHIDAIKRTIDLIITNDYPSKTDRMPTTSISKHGKKDDPSAPQNEIKNYVRIILNNAHNKISGFDHFIHKTEKRNGQPHISNITYEIIDKGLSGPLDFDATYKRVSQALKEIESELS